MDSKEINSIYKVLKNKNNQKYDEEKHCKLLIQIMMDKNKSDISYFCTEAMIAESTFFYWARTHEIFGNVYQFCKMVSKKLWLEEGNLLKDEEYQMGCVNYSWEHWRLMGWAKFGISKNSRIKINFDPTASAVKHYETLLKQANEGDFTAAEFKQLMEAVNVGINVHNVFELQKQIDELKSDLIVISANKDVKNTIADKSFT